MWGEPIAQLWASVSLCGKMTFVDEKVKWENRPWPPASENVENPRLLMNFSLGQLGRTLYSFRPQVPMLRR